MDHSINPVLSEYFRKQAGVSNITFNESAGTDRIPVPVGKIIQHNSVEAFSLERCDSVGADKASPAWYQDGFHVLRYPCSSVALLLHT
jgi:hypothetical protein